LLGNEARGLFDPVDEESPRGVIEPAKPSMTKRSRKIPAATNADPLERNFQENMRCVYFRNVGSVKVFRSSVMRYVLKRFWLDRGGVFLAAKL
jgi:hypothetical protein